MLVDVSQRAAPASTFDVYNTVEIAPPSVHRLTFCLSAPSSNSTTAICTMMSQQDEEYRAWVSRRLAVIDLEGPHPTEAIYYGLWQAFLMDSLTQDLPSMLHPPPQGQEPSDAQTVLRWPNPQGSLHITQYDNDGKLVTKAKLPDFYYALCRATPNSPDGGRPDLPEVVPGHHTVTQYIRLLLVECKRDLDMRKIPVERRPIQLRLTFEAAQKQAEVQVQFHFNEIPYPYVVSVVTVGGEWSWRAFKKDASVKPISVNIDATYREGSPAPGTSFAEITSPVRTRASAGSSRYISSHLRRDSLYADPQKLYSRFGWYGPTEG